LEACERYFEDTNRINGKGKAKNKNPMFEKKKRDINWGVENTDVGFSLSFRQSNEDKC
jgi:hypothetical protein